MDYYIMQYYYRSKFLVVLIDANVHVYKNEKYKFDPAFISSQAKIFFIAKPKVFQMLEFSEAADNIYDFDGNTILLECEDYGYVYISGLEINKFKTDDKIIDYISL